MALPPLPLPPPVLFPPKNEVSLHFLLLPLLLVLEAEEEAPLERRSSLGAASPRLERTGRLTEYFRGMGTDDESSASGDVMPGVDILRPGRGGPEASPIVLPARLPRAAQSYWLRMANESRPRTILFSHSSIDQ